MKKNIKYYLIKDLIFWEIEEIYLIMSDLKKIIIIKDCIKMKYKIEIFSFHPHRNSTINQEIKRNSISQVLENLNKV